MGRKSKILQNKVENLNFFAIFANKLRLPKGNDALGT